MRKANRFFHPFLLPSFLLAALQVVICNAQPATKDFAGSIVTPPPPTGPGQNAERLEPQTLNRFLTLHFSLKARNSAELEQRVMKGETVSPSEFAAKYSGDPDSAHKLASWLKSNGFRDISVTPDSIGVYARATVDQIQKNLQVEFQSIYQNGKRVVSAKSPPKLPQDIGASVVAIDGLQPWVQARPQIIFQRSYLSNESAPKSLPSPAPAVAAIAQTRAPSPAGSVAPRPASIRAPALLVKALVNRYNANLPGVTGKGQTIAILTHLIHDGSRGCTLALSQLV